MKVGIFDPYLDTLGGGERYMMTIAEYLSSQGHQVDVFWKDKEIKEKIEKLMSLDVNGIRFYSNGYKIFTQKKNLFKRFKICRNYNLFIHLSDGSIPFLFAEKNIIHFQVPFHDVGGKNSLNKIKLRFIDKVICNSQFTKKFIDKEYGVNSVVIYPPVDVEHFKPLKKENIILSVGRFYSPLHAKKQEVIVEVFKKICDQGFTDWQLVLIGGSSNNRTVYLNQLKRAAENCPIEILVNLPFAKLKQYYGKAKIYWHAAGLGIDEDKEPEKVEHFGMAIVEAMAAGCVPVVVGKGGPREIIKNKENGFLWQNKSELEAITIKLIKEKELYRKICQVVVKSSQRFSKKRFCRQFNELVF